MGITDLSKDDNYWMRKALDCAKKAESQGEVPVGAVIVQDGKLVAEGWNQTISQNDCCAHAEIMALRAAGLQQKNYRLVDCTVYVTLEPCVMCAGALIHSRVSKVVFAADDPKTGAAGSVFSLLVNPLHNQCPEVVSGVMKKECSQFLTAFFKRRRKEKKAPLANK